MATLQSKVAFSPDVVFCDLDNEAVMLNTASGQYYGLDEVGTRMWELLGQHAAVQPAYEALLREYEVDGPHLQQELVEFVEELASRQLVRVDEE